MSETDDHAQDEHPEVDRAYDRGEGGEVPEDQQDYRGPDPESDSKGDEDAEDQGT